MRGRTTLAAVSVAVAVLWTAPAWAGPAEDGNAGLQAMDRGDFATAERLFTRVLKSPSLSAQDREFAYASRGRSYLRQSRYIQACADLAKAVALNPADADAAAALKLAEMGKSGASPMAVQWGGYNALAGATWVRVETHEDKKHRQKTEPMSYLTYAWATPGQVLNYSGQDRNGNAISGQIQRDPATGLMADTLTAKGQTVTIAVDVTADGFVELGDEGATRITAQRGGDGGFDVAQDAYANNSWSRAKSYRLVQSADLQAQVDRKAAVKHLLKCLGEGAKAGLLSGLLGADAPAAQQSADCGGQQQQDGASG